MQRREGHGVDNALEERAFGRLRKQAARAAGFAGGGKQPGGEAVEGPDLRHAVGFERAGEPRAQFTDRASRKRQQQNFGRSHGVGQQC